MAGRERGHRRVVAGVLALLVGAAAFGAAQTGLLPSIGGHDAAPATSSVIPPPTGPGLDLRQPAPAPDVLAAADGGRPVSIARLRRHLAAALALPDLGGHFGFAVTQLGNPTDSWRSGAATVTPASTMKLLTTTAALATLGPEHRFTTSVVRGRAAGSIVLVGGGDPLLSDATPTPAKAAELYPQPASLHRLAVHVAARLTLQGVRRVRLGYDASLFTGPAVNPHWPSTYLPDNVVSPISALWVDEGRTAPGQAERSTHPAQDAALAFRAQLVHAGIKVAGVPQSRLAPRSHEVEVAAVSSAPLDQIVEHVLELSDNEAAEVLLRQVALATSRPASSAGGVAAVRSTLTALGLGRDLRRATFYDGSGLSRQDVVPVPLLLDVLSAAASTDNPALRGVITGLPVAGFSGSLGYRFDHLDAHEGLGYVRAKTGTLTGVHGLAGLAVTRTGQVLVFVAVADKVPVALTVEARADLDRVAAELSGCGC